MARRRVSSSRSTPRSASASCARSCGQLLEALRQLVALAARALAIELDAARAILQLAVLRARRRRRARAHRGDASGASTLPRAAGARRASRAPRPAAASNCARSVGRLLAVRRDARAVRFALRAPRARRAGGARARCAGALRPPPSRRGSAATCSRCVDTRRSSSVRCASAAARVPCAASRACSAVRDTRFFGRGARLAQLAHALARVAQLVVPRFHLALRERELDGEAARRELGVALGALALARQRAHLALHFADQVVEALQVDRRLLEAPLGRAAAVAIEADAGRFLEQLATVVGAVGEQRVDHLALDDDAGVGAEARAAQQVGDVAQAARRAIQEVLALARAREAARDDHFLERRPAARRPRSRSAARPRRRSPPAAPTSPGRSPLPSSRRAASARAARRAPSAPRRTRSTCRSRSARRSPSRRRRTPSRWSRRTT